MGVYVRVHEVLVTDIRHNKFTVSQSKCSLVCHGVFGRPKCRAEHSSNPLGASSHIEPIGP